MAGYSDNPLWKKLGLKENMHILIKELSKYECLDYIMDYPGIIRKANEYEKELDFIHLFVDSMETLRIEINIAMNFIKKNGMIWISWPKKSSKAITDIDENRIRDLVLPIGLVDVKVCSVTDEFWSGLKIVWRKTKR